MQFDHPKDTAQDTGFMLLRISGWMPRFAHDASNQGNLVLTDTCVRYREQEYVQMWSFRV